MLVKPALLSNDRAVNQNSTAPVTNEIHPIAANPTPAATAMPPSGQFEVLRGGATGLAGTAEWTGGGAAATSPTPGNGTAASDCGLGEVVGAIISLFFRPNLQELQQKLDDQNKQTQNDIIRGMT
jgi:hypothetical protein